jgi:hypothetical protein
MKIGRYKTIIFPVGLQGCKTWPLALMEELKFVKGGIVGSGGQLGPLGTAATNRRIVPAPGDYDDG